VKEEYDPQEHIIFFGWLRGPKVVGMDRIDRKKMIAVAVVSLDDNPEFGWQKVKDVNHIAVPMYKLRGWIDRKKLYFFEKIFFYFLCATMKLKGLNNHSEPIFNAMMEGGSFYDETGLEQLLQFAASNK
jgi:hypothetical protein